MTYQIGKMKLEKYSPDIVIEVSRHICNTFDFYKAEELVEAGRHAANKKFEEFKKNSVTSSNQPAN
jgi:NTE family protein